MKKISFIAALGLSLLAASVQAQTKTPALAGVEVKISLQQDGKLDLSYTLPPGCEVLPLRGGPWSFKQQREWRKDWLPADDCGTQSDAGITRHRASCPAVRFTLTPRAYSQEQPMSPASLVDGQGVMLHTGSIAPTEACGPVQWHFASAKGSVMLDGFVRGSAMRMAESAMPGLRFTSLYLSLQPLDAGAALATIVGAGVPPWLRSSISEAAEGIMLHYHQTLPQAEVGSAALIVTQGSDTGAMRFTLDGGRSRMLRLNYLNPTEQIDARQSQSVRSSIAHEVAHILQPGLQSPALVYPERTLMIEGGAEFLRWMSEYRLGWKSSAQLADELDEALNLCLMEVGDLPWKRFLKRNVGRTPNQCGLAIHVMVLAARQSPLSAETVLGNLYAALRKNPATDIARALECGEVAACSVQVLPDLLGGNVGFGVQMRELMTNLAIIKKSDLQPNAQASRLFSRAAFSQLMTEDCSSLAYWVRDSYFEIGRSETCKTFEAGMKISKAEGVSLFDEPRQAAQAIAGACDKNGAVNLRTLEDRAVRVECRNPYRPSKNFYKLDTGKILTLLDAR